MRQLEPAFDFCAAAMPALDVPDQGVEFVPTPRGLIRLHQKVQEGDPLPARTAPGRIASSQLEIQPGTVGHEHRSRAVQHQGVSGAGVAQRVEQRALLGELAFQRRLHVQRVSLRGDVHHQRFATAPAVPVLDDVADVTHPDEAALLGGQPVFDRVTGGRLELPGDLPPRLRPIGPMHALEIDLPVVDGVLGGGACQIAQIARGHLEALALGVVATVADKCTELPAQQVRGWRH